MNVKNSPLPINLDCLEVSAHREEQLSQEREKIEKSSWLEKGHPLGSLEEISFKLLCLIAGDSFIGNTKYGGGIPSAAVSYFLDFFRQLKGEDAQPEIMALLENAQDIEQLKNGDSSFFMNNIGGFTKDRDIIWFPAGWIDRINSSHAIMLEIDTKSNSVTIFNPGEGLQYHGHTRLHSIDPTGQQTYSDSDQCFLKITHCDPSKINSSEFYRFLYEMHNNHKTDPNIELGPDLFYKGIKKFLKGTFEKNKNPEKNPLLYVKPQRGGTCSVKGLLRAIYYKLQGQKDGLAKYKRLKFLWQSRALVGAMKNEILPEEKYLLENIVENMARATDKEPLKSGLSTEEMSQWEATLLHIQSELLKLAAHRPGESDHQEPDILSISAPCLPLYKSVLAKKHQSREANKKPGRKDHDSFFEVFKTEESPVQSYSELSIVESTAKLKELALTLKEHPEKIGLIYTLYTRIVKIAKNDPEAKLEGYSVNLDPIEEHILNPVVVFIDPKTHTSLKESLEYLRSLGKKNQLFKPEKGKILISGKTMKTDPTLKYFSQFLKKSGHQTELEKMQELLTHPERLPESVRCLYEAWYYSTAVLRSVSKVIPEFSPKPQTIKVSCPTQLAVDFQFSPKSIVLPGLLTDHPYQTVIESTLKQNEIVSGLLLDQIKGGNLDKIAKKNVHMIGLDPIDIPNHLVAFFSMNMDLFAKDGACSYMLSQLFRPFLLLDQIKAQPLFLKKLEEFCAHAIDHFIETGEYERAMNCIVMTDRLNTFLMEAGYQTDFPRLRSKIIDEIMPKIVANGKPQEGAGILRVLLNDLSGEEQNLDYNLDYNLDLTSYMFLCTQANVSIDDSLKEKYEKRPDQIKDNLLIRTRVLKYLGLQGDNYIVDYPNLTVHNEDRSALVKKRGEVTGHPFYMTYFKGCDVKWTENKDSITLSSRTKEITLLPTALGFDFIRNFDNRRYKYSSSDSMESAWFNIPGTLWKSMDNQYESLLVDEKSDKPCIKFIYNPRTGVLVEATRLSDLATLQGPCNIPQSLDGIWIDRKGTFKEFSYLHLKFSSKKVDGRDRLYCEQYPGYFLVKNTSKEKISRSYFTLRNMAGQEILLIENKGVQNSNLTPFAECRFVNGILTGTSLSDKLFLIEYHLTRHEHVSAYNLVKELNFLEPILDNPELLRWEMTNLESIFDFLKEKKHPNEQAIYLHLVKLELENRMRFSNKMNGQENKLLYSPEEVSKIFNEYLRNETNCTICRLTSKEKLDLSNLLELSGFEEWCGRIISSRGHELKEQDLSEFLHNPSFVREGLVFSPKYFDKNYENLYQIAASGNAAEKKWLGNVLDFNYAYHTASSSYTRIYNKYRWPYLPSRVESIYRSLSFFFDKAVRLIGKTIEKFWIKRINHQMPLKNNPVSRPVAINPHSMKEADESFDTYFKSLIDKYFLLKAIPEKVSNDLLPSKNPSKLVEAKLNVENQDLQYFRDHILKPSQEIELQNLLDLKNEIDVTITSVSGELKTMKTALLWQINTGDTFKRIGYRRKLEWKDLQKLSIAADFNLFAKETALDHKSAEKVLSMVGYYLVLESRLQQMSNISEILRNAESVIPNSPKRKLLINQAYETINLFTSDVRTYTQVDRLWFECTNKYLYRKNQLEKLKEILDSHQEFSEIQAEMPTGYGKTKAMVPTLSEAMSKKGKAVVNCWPATLEMTNLADMQSQMKNSFGRGIDRLTFDRASNFTADNLAVIYRVLLEDKENGRPINCCPEAVRALELHFLLTLDSQPVDNKKLIYFIKILSFLRNDAWATIDEEHVLLNPMDRLIYTLGDAVPIPDRDIDIVEKLFKELLRESFKSRVDLSNDGTRLVSEDQYQVLAEDLANEFSQDLGCASYSEEFISFVTGANENEPKWLEKHPKREEISLLKGVLCFILKSSLNGSVDEDFGFSKKHFQTTGFAISYSSANTPNETPSGPSQYKNPHETLIKTYITYLYKGLQPEQVENLIRDLQVKVELEMAQGVAVGKIEAYRIYRTFNVSSKKSLIDLEKADIEVIAEELAKNQKAIYHYIKSKVVPQIRIYEESIASDAQNFRSQFASSLSLSATPQNQAAHGPTTQFLPMKGTSGQVTHLLMTKCNKKESIHDIHSTAPAQAVEEVTAMLKARNDIKAVIDIGARFKGLSNYEIAVKLIEDSHTDVEGVLFFDEKEGVFKIIDKKSNNIFDFSSEDIAPEERLTLYDQSRCFGSDLVQSCDAVALLLTSKRNTKSEIGQGVGRMRGLHKGQSVEIGVPAEISEQEEIKDLLVYWIANQAEQEALLNYHSQVQQYDNLLRRELLDTMLKAGGNLSVIKSIFKKNRKTFISRETFSPYQQYARTPKSMATEKALENKKNRVISQINASAGLTSHQRKTLIEQLNIQAKKEILLPHSVAGGSNIGMDCEVLQEVEVEVELELENRNVLQDPVILRDPIQWNEKLDLFKKGWEGTGSLYPLFKRTIGIFLGRLPGTLLNETIILTKNIQAGGKTILLCIGVAVLAPVIATVSSIAITALVSVTSAFWVFDVILFTLAATATNIFAYSILSGTVAISTLIFQPINLLVKKIAIYVAKEFHADNYICRVDEIMKIHLKKEHWACHRIFSPNFFATNNFYNQSSYNVTQDEMIPPQAPLNVDEKPMFEIMLIEDAGWFGRKRLKAVAIDKNDSIFFRKKLQEDIEDKISNAGRRSRKVAIYDPINEIIVAQGRNAFLIDDLDKRPEFHELLASAKFLNGEIRYIKKELAYLEKKIKSIGKKPVRNFFFNRILSPFQPKNLNYLKGQKASELYRLLA